MPDTQNTPAYKHSRKTEVYEVAYAEAAEEGGISHKERALLDRLRDTLELSPDEASAIEARSSMGSESGARVGLRRK